MPEEQVDAMVAARGRPAAAGDAGRACADRDAAARSWRGDLRSPTSRSSRTATIGGLAPCLSSGLQLGDVAGFVFDVDGTLAQRGADGVTRPLPGAADVLERDPRLRPSVSLLFTNGEPRSVGRVSRAGLREKGLPVGDDELLTPPDSAITLSPALPPGPPGAALRQPTRSASGSARRAFRLAERRRAPGVVLVAHVDEIDFASLERAARAVLGGSASC